MEIKIKIDDELIKRAEQRINKLSNRKIEDILSRIATASFHEYLDMIVGNGMPNRIIDVQYLRIIKLIENYFEYFPSENELAKIMHITASKAKTLLNNLKSIYSNQISDKLDKKIIEFLNSNEEEDCYEFKLESYLIFQILNELISQNFHGLKKIYKKEETSGKVIIPPDTFNKLCEYYNIKKVKENC